MTTTGNVVEGFTTDQLKAMLKLATDAEKAVQQAAAQRYGHMLTEFVGNVVTENDIKQSDKSAWVGYSLAGIPVEVEGTQYTVSITVTDTAAKKAREPEFAKK